MSHILWGYVSSCTLMLLVFDNSTDVGTIDRKWIKLYIFGVYGKMFSFKEKEYSCVYRLINLSNFFLVLQGYSHICSHAFIHHSNFTKMFAINVPWLTFSNIVIDSTTLKSVRVLCRSYMNHKCCTGEKIMLTKMGIGFKCVWILAWAYLCIKSNDEYIFYTYWTFDKWFS